MDGFGIIVVILIIMLIIGFGYAFRSENLSKQSELIQQADLSKAKDQLHEIISRFNIPTFVSNKRKDLHVVKYNGKNFSFPKFAYLWMKESELNILIFDMNDLGNENFSITNDVIHVILINDDIDYFFNSGEFYTENQVSGGGGGGVSLTGTLVGGALLGGVGAVIGSRKKVDPITSELLVHDTRETILKYHKNGKEQFIHFELDKMKILFNFIPQKSFDIVYSNEIRKSQQSSSNVDEISEKLRKLKQLKEEGLLTELEYENKRMSIINNI